jgi:hypothetical protein
MKTVRRHVTLPLTLIEEAHRIKGVSLSKLVQRGLELALAEIRGGVLPPPPATPTPPSFEPMQATKEAAPHKPKASYHNPLGMVPLFIDGTFLLPMYAFVQAVGITVDELRDEIDDEDVQVYERIEYISWIGINTALAIAARNGVDPALLDCIDHWAQKQQPTTTA